MRTGWQMSPGFLGDIRCWKWRCFSTSKSWGKELKTKTKQLCDPDNNDGIVSHSEPDVLECEVKWALGSIAANKASGGDGIPAELFKILKDYAVKVLHSLCQQICQTQQWLQDWKRSILIPIPNKGSTKECASHWTTALISHASKVTLKILQVRLQHYMNWELPDVQAGLRKGRGSRDQISNIGQIMRKKGNSRKTSISVPLTMLKLLTVGIIMNCGKLLKWWEYQTILPVSWEICMQVNNQQFKPCMEQLTGLGLRKEYNKAVYCHLV